MTDRPILMSAPMVRALMREIEQPGTGKTQTRRLAWRDTTAENNFRDGCPTIWQSVKPGDRLWVKETWRTHAMFDHIRPRDLTTKSIHYDADGPAENSSKTRVSIHMTRRISRLSLLVTATKMERVREINGLDALAEGIGREKGVAPWRLYCRLWKSLHTKPGDRWEDNPEVVALTFRPVLANIDAVGEAA